MKTSIEAQKKFHTTQYSVLMDGSMAAKVKTDATNSYFKGYLV